MPPRNAVGKVPARVTGRSSKWKPAGQNRQVLFCPQPADQEHRKENWKFEVQCFSVIICCLPLAPKFPNLCVLVVVGRLPKKT